jgi:hypothetical protein
MIIQSYDSYHNSDHIAIAICMIQYHVVSAGFGEPFLDAFPTTQGLRSPQAQSLLLRTFSSVDFTTFDIELRHWWTKFSDICTNGRHASAENLSARFVNKSAVFEHSLLLKQAACEAANTCPDTFTDCTPTESQDSQPSTISEDYMGQLC